MPRIARDSSYSATDQSPARSADCYGWNMQDRRFSQIVKLRTWTYWWAGPNAKSRLVSFWRNFAKHQVDNRERSQRNGQGNLWGHQGHHGMVFRPGNLPDDCPWPSSFRFILGALQTDHDSRQGWHKNEKTHRISGLCDEQLRGLSSLPLGCREASWNGRRNPCRSRRSNDRSHEGKSNHAFNRRPPLARPWDNTFELPVVSDEGLLLTVAKLTSTTCLSNGISEHRRTANAKRTRPGSGLHRQRLHE